MGASSEVSLKVTEADISNLTASIRSPSGLVEPCMLKRLANGHLGTAADSTASCSLSLAVSVAWQSSTLGHCWLGSEKGIRSRLGLERSRYRPNWTPANLGKSSFSGSRHFFCTTFGWRFGVAVTRWSRSTQLLCIEPS